MKRTMFKSKLHRVTVTHADLAYEGSVTIDETLMRAANILPYEQVRIWNVTNGSRIETYALPGKAGSGIVCVKRSCCPPRPAWRHGNHRHLCRGRGRN